MNFFCSPINPICAEMDWHKGDIESSSVSSNCLDLNSACVTTKYSLLRSPNCSATVGFVSAAAAAAFAFALGSGFALAFASAFAFPSAFPAFLSPSGAAGSSGSGAGANVRTGSVSIGASSSAIRHALFQPATCCITVHGRALTSKLESLYGVSACGCQAMPFTASSSQTGRTDGSSIRLALATSSSSSCSGGFAAGKGSLALYKVVAFGGGGGSFPLSFLGAIAGQLAALWLRATPSLPLHCS
mmetsp:Transcript_7387/g.16188  ORF Transcript_7387/g.16188 Transcript_7387/m.16188 type:complete len:244 (+) Transcript_7387:3836-4567(+)